MSPLRYKLRSGDIVEILTQPGHHPSRDWLAFVKSSRARQKIKHWLNIHQRERAIEIGRKLIEKEARKYRISLKAISEAELMRVAERERTGATRRSAGGDRLRKVFRALASWRKLVPPSRASSRSRHPRREDQPGGFTSVVRRVFGGDSSPLKVKGHDDLLVYRARCCNPIRGEEIIGYVTRGKGVAVHSKICNNVENLMYEPERRIAVEWGKDGKRRHRALCRPAFPSSWWCFATTVPAC